MEKEIGPNWDKLLGATPEKNKDLTNELFALQDKSAEHLEKHELKPTTEEITSIFQVESDAREIAQHYGGAGREFPVKNIVVVDADSMIELRHDKRVSGSYQRYFNDIIIKRTGSNLDFRMRLMHELLHYQGYTSFREHDDKAVALHRGGITVFENDISKNDQELAKYFAYIEEALLGLLTQEYFKNNLAYDRKFTEELKAVEVIKSWIWEHNIRRRRRGDEVNLDEINEMLAQTYSFHKWQQARKIIEAAPRYPDDEMASDAYRWGYIAGLTGHARGEPFDINRFCITIEYPDEIKQFRQLIDDIIKKSGNKYSFQEIMDMFARAHFSGKLLPLARVIEQALGQGTFRKIGEKFGSK